MNKARVVLLGTVIGLSLLAQQASATLTLSLDEFTVSLDFGTAPVEAFWEFLDTLKEAGITSLLVDNRP